MAEDALDRWRPTSVESRRALDGYAAEFAGAPSSRRRLPTTARFSAQVFQNEFLPAGGTDVHAIVSLTCSEAGPARASSGEVAEILVVGTSASLQGERIIALRRAVAAALDEVLDGTWFALVDGAEVALCAFPPPGTGSPMVRMTPQTREAAKDVVGRLTAGGGRSMGSWLRLAAQLFDTVPAAVQRHAVLLTDGRDETPEDLASAITEVAGRFRCDCRGLGADWDVAEVRAVARALLGTVDLIPGPDELVEALPHLIREAMGRGVPDARLRVWAPQGAQLLFVRQLVPQVEDLTDRRFAVNPQTAGFATGAWGDESRDYHVAVRLPAGPIGSERLAARVQLVVDDEVMAEGLVRAVWSDDDRRTSPINPVVAHYTEQAELAEAIREGLEATATDPTAT